MGEQEGTHKGERDPMSVTTGSSHANMVILQEKLVPFITELNIHLAHRSEKMEKKKNPGEGQVVAGMVDAPH